MKKFLKIFLIVVITVLLAVSFVKCAPENNQPLTAAPEDASDNQSRLDFISSYGWIVDDEPVEKALVLIPEVFSSVLSDYNQMQKKAGFDITPYLGKEVTRFSYKLTNHPVDSQYARVNLFVYKDKIISADVMSTKLGGFMHGINEKDISINDITR